MRRTAPFLATLGLLLLIGWYLISEVHEVGDPVGQSTVSEALSERDHLLQEVGEVELSAPIKQPASKTEVADFRQWAEAWKFAEAEEREVLLDVGIRLAAERRAVLKQLIQEDPEQALAMAIGQEEREGLPFAVTVLLEKEVASAGDFLTTITCLHTEEEGHVGYAHAIRRELLADGRKYTPFTYGERLNIDTKRNIPLYGIAVDGLMALHESPVQVLRQDTDTGALEVRVGGQTFEVQNHEELEVFESAWKQREAEGGSQTGDYYETVEEAVAAYDQAAGIVFEPFAPPTGPAPPTDVYDEYTGSGSHQLGPKTVMVIMIQPSDGQVWNDPPTEVELNNQLDDASQWYYNASYRKTWFGPKERSDGKIIPRLTVTPVLPVSSTLASIYDDLGAVSSVAKAAARAQGGDWAVGGLKDYAYYDRIVIMCKDDLDASTGVAFVNGEESMTANALNGGVAYHEWGHNWGVYHANRWEVDGAPSRDASGSSSEYGDGRCIMGGSASYFNQAFAERIYFLQESDGDVQTVTSSGTYRLYDYSSPYANNATSDLRAIKIPITGTSWSSKFLQLGFHHDGGTDGGTERRDIERNAVSIRARGLGGTGSFWLDLTPDSKTDETEDRDDGALVLGRTYSEPADLNGTSLYGEVHITPVARGSVLLDGNTHEWIDVTIHLGDFSSNNAPTAGITPSATDVGVGVSVSLTANANDTDGDSLSYHWDFGNGSYSYDNLPNQSASYSSAGLYEVVLRVSDGKGGVAKVSHWINVGGVAFLNPVTPPVTVGGLHYQYYEGSWSAVPNFDELLPLGQGTLATVSHSPKQRSDEFAFLYEGYLTVPATEVYTFYLNSDDGSKLYLDGQLVIDNDRNGNGAVEKQANVGLNAGVHRFRLEYFHFQNSEVIDLDWKSQTATANERANLPSSFYTQTDTASNSAPSVSISSPTAGSSFTQGEGIAMTVTASDADGIEKVVFFAGSTYLGTDTSSPYSLEWSNAPIGSYQLSAIAYDALGLWAQSSTVSIDVNPSEVREMINLNFRSEASSSEGNIGAADVVGAVFAGANWNNLHSAQQDGLNGTVTALKDSNGVVSPAAITWWSNSSSSYVSGESTADTSSPAGKLFRGMITSRGDQNGPDFDVSGIPYLAYDVYVYFEGSENRTEDRDTHVFTIIPSSGPSESRYGRNSLTAGDGIGDYPSYDSWTGFKEATATVQTAPQDALLGNYVVFPGLYASAFNLSTDNLTGSNTIGIAGIQIVEASPTVPLVSVKETSFTTDVSEAGGDDTLEVRLTIAPTNGATVTVDLLPDGELGVDTSSLVFTAANFDTVQTVTVSAQDDTDKEGTPHTGLLNFSVNSSVASNYSGLSVNPVSVNVTDDDLPTLDVSATVNSLAEGGTSSSMLTVTRSDISSLAAAQSFSFAITGSATGQLDFTMSGIDGFNTVSGLGSATIPAGSASVNINLSVADDDLGEAQETFAFALQADAGNYALGSNASEGFTIADNEVPTAVENFDAFTAVGSGNSWANGGGSMSWSLRTGGTPSQDTGPNGDHTSGSGKYLYTEATLNSGETAELLSPVYDLSGTDAAGVEFFYHLYGEDMGALHVDVFAGGSWHTSVWSISGQQHNSHGAAWTKASIGLSQFARNSDVQVRFRGIVGSNFKSDMAIDDFAFYSGGTVAATLPTISSHPVSAVELETQSASLSVVADGIPAPTYQWRKGGAAISGATSDTLVISPLMLGDAGNYDVVVTNSEGSVTSNTATLSVTAWNPPVITAQPAGSTIDEGQSTGLSVSASGSGLSYQWYLGSSGDTGSPIAGATSANYNTPSLNNTTDYWVRVLSASGWADSNTATISINFTNDLLIYWSFDAGTATDQSPNGNDGVLSGATVAAGQLGQGLSFSGASGDQIVDGDAENALNGLGAISIALWVKSDETNTDKGFVNGVLPDGSGMPLSFRYDAAGFAGGGSNLIQFALQVGAESVFYESANNVQTTAWQHLVMTWQSGQLPKLYRDGVLDVPTYAGDHPSSGSGNGAVVSGSITGLDRLLVGKSAKDDASSWNGLLDEFRLYNRVLTPSEVSDLYAGTPIANYASWSTGVSWGGADSSEGADPDGDGLDNFGEYALDSDPTLADQLHRPVLVESAGNYFLRVRLGRDSTEVSYEVQFSEDLQDWSGIPAVPVTGSAGQQQDVLIDLGASQKRFARLRMSQ